LKFHLSPLKISILIQIINNIILQTNNILYYIILSSYVYIGMVLKIRVYFVVCIEIVNAGFYSIFYVSVRLDLSKRTSTDDEHCLKSKHFHFHKAGLTPLSRSIKNDSIYRFPIKSKLNIKYMFIYYNINILWYIKKLS